MNHNPTAFYRDPASTVAPRPLPERIPLETVIENLHARRTRTRTWLALSAVLVILVLVIAPPFISVRRYKHRITEIVSASVGRPVRLSSVELRILPRPSFIITDLVIEEDPAYGAEPVLHANTVTASIRLFPLWWRARLEISRISVDEASLNLVRTGAGRWNLDSFIRTTAVQTQSRDSSSQPVPFPYLEATNSRVNIKDGVEKLPYSLVNADLSFSQEAPGDWRVRLKGQPARTDVNLDLADTGVVRLEGRLRREPGLPHTLIHFDLDWRDAQLGQLSRLLLGNDQGWRGDLAGEVHVDGTAEAAQFNTRLRASGVHRAEFAPASPMDFDATCKFVYHHFERALEKLECYSPVGEGRVRLTAAAPGRGASSRLTLELDRVPAQVGLDALRTLRSGLDPTLEAAGAISGRITYAGTDTSAAPPLPTPTGKAGTRAAKAHAPQPGPLSGNLSITGLRISGDALPRPMQLPKVTVEPAPGLPSALLATVAIAEGAPTALNVTARLTLNGYQVGVHGGAALARLRDLAHLARVPHASVLDQIEGPPATLDLTANGPWLPSPAPLSQSPGAGATPDPVMARAVDASDRIGGIMTLHGATWKPDFLASPVEIGSATLRLDEKGGRWDPVGFSYGPVRGSATLELAAECQADAKCAPQLTLDFGSLDAAALQAAILGARKPGTLLSSVLARFRPASSPHWPELLGAVRAHTFVLGPVTLNDAVAAVRLQADSAEIESLDAGLLGGRVHAQGSVTPGELPDYKLEGRFDQLNAEEVGQLVGMTWSGAAIDGGGELEVAGFTAQDLATSAKGSLHFDWRHGSIVENGEIELPPVLVKFDRWTAEAAIADGAITLTKNQVQRGPRKVGVEGSAAFGDPPRVALGESPDTRAATSRSKP